jgi:hypothetical protein
MVNNSTRITSCPAGGTFWLCPNTLSNFIGCCKSNGPCDSGCSASELQPTAVTASLVGTLPDQQCPSGAQFYQCANTSPPFWGCCKSDPCQQNGCPTQDLSPAIISSQQSQWQIYAPPNTTMPTSTPSPVGSKNTHGISVGIIVGAAAGGVVAIILFFALIYFWAKRRRDVRGIPVKLPKSLGEWESRESKPTLYMGYGMFILTKPYSTRI